MIELVVLDMAGTTVYDGDAVSVCFRAALAAVEVFPEPAAVNAVMGLHKPEAVRLLLAASGMPYGDGTVEAVHADFVERMLRYYRTDPAVREVPAASAVFAQLRRAGIKVALNTGFGRAIVNQILDRLEWHGQVDAVIASDEVAHGRPHPDMIRALMTKLGVKDPRNVAKVGDTPVDLEEGKNAGCGVILGVTTGAFTRQELEAVGVGRIIDSVAEVPGQLGTK